MSIERQRLLCEDSGNQDPTLHHLQETYIKFKNLHKNGPSKKKKKKLLEKKRHPVLSKNYTKVASSMTDKVDFKS